MDGFVINLDGRKDRLDSFMQQEYLPFPFQRIRAIKSRIGEDGCTQSHLLALRSIVTYPALICEDDCVFLYHWSYIEKFISALPETWDALWLGANLQAPLTQYSPLLYHLEKAYCLHAVIYNSKEMVDYVLHNHNTPSGKNLDIFYHEQIFSRFRCFIPRDMCANQRDGVSNICGDYTAYGDELAERYVKMTIG